jgi:hypothetical protein
MLHDGIALDFIDKPRSFEVSAPDSVLALLTAEAIQPITGVRRQ